MTTSCTRTAPPGDDPTAAQRHPAWCFLQYACAGTRHYSTWTSIPATGGDPRLDGEWAEFPVVDVVAVLDGDRPYVAITARSPLVDNFPGSGCWVDVDVPAGMAHNVVTAVFNAICGTAEPYALAGHGSHGPVVVSIASAGDTVITTFSRDGRDFPVAFRPAEARQFADAVTRFAAMSTAPARQVSDVAA